MSPTLPESLPTVDIVIVSWNVRDQLAECLASLTHLRGETVALARVVVVDNASSDGSASAAAAYRTRLPIEVICNDTNSGFAAACNQGATGSSADFLLFLNPDTRVYPDTLDRAARVMVADRDIGVVGIRLVDEEGETARTATRALLPRHVAVAVLGLDKLVPAHFHTHFMHEWNHDSTREVDHVIGAFYLVPRVVFVAVGGFDERFFVYLEDLDLSQRIRQTGRRVVYFAEAEAFHQGGGASEQAKAARLFYSLRSRILYGFKHFARPTAQALALVTLVVEPLVRLGHLIARRDRAGIAETLQGYRRLWAQGRDLLSGRVRIDG